MAGSGVTFSNLSTYSGAHALIVGSDFKRYGRLYYHIFKIADYSSEDDNLSFDIN